MKSISAAFLLVGLTMLVSACDSSDPSLQGHGIGIVQNGFTQYASENLATIFFDASKDSIELAEKGRTQKIQGPRGGSAEVIMENSKVADLKLTAKKYSILFNELNLRQGYPTFKSGRVKTDLRYSALSIQGTVSGEKVLIADIPVDFDLSYDLYFKRDFWRGRMKGTITMKGEKYSVDHDYDSPILSSVEIDPKRLENGETITLIVRANSNSPVVFLSSSLDSPIKNVFGGGSGVPFTEIDKGYWEYRQTSEILSYMPSGRYTFSHVAVQNEAQLTSLEWENISFDVIHSTVADKPVIESVTVSTANIQNGGKVVGIVRVKGETPPSYLRMSLEGPTGNLLGGGSQVTFKKVASGLWEHYFEKDFSEWLPSGKYLFKDISVENAGQIPSIDYPEVKIDVQNHLQAEVPVIESVTLNSSIIKSGGVLELTIRARSNAPAAWLNINLEGPRGNIFGGGSETAFERVGPDVWQYKITHKISSDAPSGVYRYEHISVGNAGLKTSEEFKPMVFSVDNN